MLGVRAIWWQAVAHLIKKEIQIENTSTCSYWSTPHPAITTHGTRRLGKRGSNKQHAMQNHACINNNEPAANENKDAQTYTSQHVYGETPTLAQKNHPCTNFQPTSMLHAMTKVHVQMYTGT